METPQVDKDAFAKLMGNPDPEPAPQPRDAVHLSPEPDPDESVADEPTEVAEPDKSDAYSRFEDAAGPEATAALREIQEGNPVDRAVYHIRETYGERFPTIRDDTVTMEILIEAEGIANVLQGAGDDAPQHLRNNPEGVLELAVMNVLNPRSADDETLEKILDGDKNRIPELARNREEHARIRREKAEKLVAGDQVKQEAHGDAVLNAILSGDHVRLSSLTGGRGVGESHRGTGTGRNLGMMGT